MRISISSPDVLAALPRVLDQIRRLGIAVDLIQARPEASNLIVQLDSDRVDQAILEALHARVLQMFGVHSVAVHMPATPVPAERPADASKRLSCAEIGR